jgi:hypothetical protein
MRYPDNAWVAPCGEIFECDYFGHYLKAEEIAKSLSIPWTGQEDSILTGLGYMRLRLWSQRKLNLPENYDKLTKKQLSILEIWLKERTNVQSF